MFETQKKSKKAQMQVYCRIRPDFNQSVLFPYEVDHKNNIMDVQQYTKSYKENLEFKYSGIFDGSCTQEQVFDEVALPVIHNCLEGYNGTIFAYGQTGSGKTYTMTGAESWQLRGIIPRVIQSIFDEVDKVEGIEYTLYVSFMEIYNENAYDLLERKHLEQPLETWNKINLFEDDYGNIHLKNISVHSCANEQEGIDLLMMGNFVRQVSATPVNQSSSRSHCIFTITIEGKQINNSSVFVSKLHLVDLAGSERAGRNQTEGQLLNEAKYINLSLSYLEQVILALNEKRKNGGRTHIPYRNSLLTTILKDSLGGNCKTVMVANISPELENYEESVSTLRFSQRVAALENEISKKEKVDLQLMVNKLEQEKLLLFKELDNYQKIILNMEGGQEILELYKNNQLEIDNLPNNSMLTKNASQNGNFQFSQQNNLEISKQVAQQPINTNIANKVDQFLNERDENIEVSDANEAYQCFYAMKQLYNTRMKEYVTELTFISEKLQKYDELLSKRKQAKEEQKKKGTNSTFAENSISIENNTTNLNNIQQMQKQKNYQQQMQNGNPNLQNQCQKQYQQNQIQNQQMNGSKPYQQH
ncbi:P-loop containing nucleoside triphosphate hydrolase [Pseudocohnilembus persalinus]|uniref:Kinesin-like protein n=1 Tax=Pseudocohnilembus persalinus TaxID=266149 RepID=A0A0V0R2F0_PSEPJ|nr:P-loop containing nucleoside triphosphate hydrolase [Pseudocohnilembus persalinus]|eukprot:KRX08676.1 P-loop containing nucleoside triphosphate hydrolase [Pseudocohnilembus persalinus]